ncbi:MAG: Rpn family recombination-promoting nuclease/putative transposase [Magnetococcales bacterium]|nr:Rpn family recombination-promoting nuclease/putative transposase [Magnetococcales bacterium]
MATTFTGKPLHVYVLIEHKSYPDRKVGWQALRGTFTFLEQKARERNDWILLPAVVQMIYYHGEQEWRVPGEFITLVDADPALHHWLINVRFVTIDVSGHCQGGRTNAYEPLMRQLLKSGVIGF